MIDTKIHRCPAQACSREEGHDGNHCCSVCNWPHRLDATELEVIANEKYDEHECYPSNTQVYPICHACGTQIDGHIQALECSDGKVRPFHQPCAIAALKKENSRLRAASYRSHTYEDAR